MDVRVLEVIYSELRGSDPQEPTEYSVHSQPFMTRAYRILGALISLL